MTGQLTEPQGEQDPQQDTNRGGLTIEHTDDAGTLIDGTTRGDGSAEVLKANGWRWSRSLGFWYVPRSRNVPPRRSVIEATARALEAAGFAVAVSVDATPVDRAAVEARRAVDAQERADRLDERAQRHEQAATDRHAAARGIADGIPLGQPILVGHHSEGRARRDVARLTAHMDAAVQHTTDAEQARSAARSAAAGTCARYNPVTVANRVARLEAQVRSEERALAELEGMARSLDPAPASMAPTSDETGEAGEELQTPEPTEYERIRARTGAALAVRVRERLEVARADLEHWRGVRAAQVADGVATDFGPVSAGGAVGAGDLVQVRGRWYEVVRANRKTVTVAGEFGARSTPWHEVQAHEVRPRERVRGQDEQKNGEGV